MDYKNAILREVEYGWSSGTMARAAFFIKISEKEIIKAEYYPENINVGDFEIHIKEHESISENDWKGIYEAVELLYPVLREKKSTNKGNGITNSLVKEQILDGGDKFDFTLTWEIDGQLICKTYYQPDYERFCVLTTLLQELVDPIGRKIPKYSEAVLTGVWLSIGKTPGKDRYSFQCKKDGDAEGKYDFYCYYPQGGKEVKYPNNRVDEATWLIIHDKVKSLKIEEQKEDRNAKNSTIILSFSNGRQPKISLNKECAETIRNTFLKIMGVDSNPKKSVWSKLFGH